ncbi:helix-turn-helix domain-containing protein [Streptomyces sp. URMC 129]|uniref:helix-turn-helix domain-containing protein n=1 Tax=Streptomyces sp. URMC 129 TaxID=3423407 RepID=UPI003F1DC743
MALGMLELLAREAPVEELDKLVRNALREDIPQECAEALERARRLSLTVYARFGRRFRRDANFTTFIQVVQELVRPTELHAALHTLTRQVRRALDLDMTFVALPYGEPGKCRVLAADGVGAAQLTGLSIPAGPGYPGTDPLVAVPPMWTPDYRRDERFSGCFLLNGVLSDEGLKAAVSMPLRHGPKWLGVLNGANLGVRHFTQEEIHLLDSLAELAGLVIEKIQLSAQNTATANELADRRRVAAEQETAPGAGDVYPRLLDAVLGGCDLGALVDRTAQLLHGPLAVFSADGTVLAASPGEPAGTDAAMAAVVGAQGAHQPLPLPDGGWAVPVRAGNRHLATVLVRPYRHLPDREQTLSAVARVVAVVLLQQRPSDVTDEERRREELLARLLEDPRHVKGVDACLRRLRIDLGRPHLLLLTHTGGGGEPKVSFWAASYARRRNGLMHEANGCVTLLLPGQDPDAAAQEVFEELTRVLGRPVTVTGTGPVSGASDIALRHREARLYLDAMITLGVTGRPASARELGSLGLLLGRRADVSEFIDSVIGPVIDYDRQRFTDLTQTLDTYFDVGQNNTRTAESLHVHPNTVARRLERVGALLRADWQQPDRLLEIQLALRLNRLRNGLSAPDA